MQNYKLLTAIGALYFLAIGISAPLMSLYLEALGANYARISLILTCFVAVMIGGNFAWGRLADRLGRRKPLLLTGLLLLAVTYLALSRADSADIAWGLRMLEGLGAAAYATVSLTLMGDSLQDAPQKGRYMGIYRGLGSVAFALGALLGGRIADRFSLSAVFALGAGVYLAAFLASLFLHEPRHRRPDPVTTGQIPAPPGACPARGLPLLFLAGVLCWVAAHSASTSMWPNYMNALGHSKTAIGSLWGLAALIEMPAMFLSGLLSDVLGRPLLLAAGGFGIGLVQVGYLFFAAFVPALVFVQVIRGFGFGSYTANAMTFTTELSSPQTRGSHSGLFHMTAGIGQLIGMFIGGRLAQSTGFAGLYFACAALALASTGCFLALHFRLPNRGSVNNS